MVIRKLHRHLKKICSEVNARRGLRIRRMVEMAGVTRSSFYRFDAEAAPGRD
jgi:predicted DNA-binding transcriptional regulator AlpA